MPKLSAENRSRRSTTYNLSPLGAPTFAPLIEPASAGWQISFDHMIPLQPVMSPVQPSPVPQSPLHYQRHFPYPSHSQQYSGRLEPPPTPTCLNPASGPWSAEEDKTLQKARSQNLSWGAIQEDYFPSKTANACRKRHERLMLKKRGNEWDEERTARLAVAYKSHREETWSPLAERLGERWEHVERACMEKGLKNILTLANSQSRNTTKRPAKDGSRKERSKQSQNDEEREDSGISLAGDSPGRRSSHSKARARSGSQGQRLQSLDIDLANYAACKASGPHS